MTEDFENVWDAIAETPKEAAELQTRAELMRKILAVIQENAWTQTEAATRCGVTLAWLNNLLRGRLSLLPSDELARVAEALGSDRRERV